MMGKAKKILLALVVFLFALAINIYVMLFANSAFKQPVLQIKLKSPSADEYKVFYGLCGHVERFAYNTPNELAVLYFPITEDASVVRFDLGKLSKTHYIYNAKVKQGIRGFNIPLKKIKDSIGNFSEFTHGIDAYGIEKHVLTIKASGDDSFFLLPFPKTFGVAKVGGRRLFKYAAFCAGLNVLCLIAFYFLFGGRDE